METNTQGKYDWAHGSNLIALAGLVSLVLRKFGVNLLPEDASVIIVATSVLVSLIINKQDKNLTLGGFRR